MEQAGQKDVGHPDQTVVLLLVKERVGALKIVQHLNQRDEVRT